MKTRRIKLDNSPAPMARPGRSASVGAPEAYRASEEELIAHTPRSAVSELGLDQIREIEGPNGNLTQIYIEAATPGMAAYTKRAVEAMHHRDKLREQREIEAMQSGLPHVPIVTMRIR